MKILICQTGRLSRLMRAAAVAPFFLAGFGCGVENHNAEDNDGPVVVTSFSILGDFASRVAGDSANVRVLAPAGSEVHEWELSPRNFIDLATADLVFTNGLGLEQWLPQLEATVPDGVRIVPLAEETGATVISIRLGDLRGEPDPHMWMDPRAAARYVEVIRDRMIELDPDSEEVYRQNARNYLDDLAALHDELTETFAAIPDEKRLLVTSEAAFLYFADAYGFDHDGIWGNNAEHEGTPQQIARIIDLIRDRRPAALFWESTITDRYVRSVSDDTGVPIAGPLYVDSLGRAGTGAETYIELMRTNARVISEAVAAGLTEGKS